MAKPDWLPDSLTMGRREKAPPGDGDTSLHNILDCTGFGQEGWRKKGQKELKEESRMRMLVWYFLINVRNDLKTI